MDPRNALQQLEAALDQFETSLYDGEDVDPGVLVNACQIFRAAGQNFDDRDGLSTGDELEPPSREATLPAGLERSMLETLAERLARVISATEMTQVSVEKELDGIAAGRRALRGYQSMHSALDSQYVSFSR